MEEKGVEHSQEFIRVKEELALEAKPLEPACVGRMSLVQPKEEAETLRPSLKELECVKEEASYMEASCSVSEECCVSEAALLAGLYSDHEVKNELVLGPECPHRPDVNLVVLGWALGDADGCPNGETVEEFVGTQGPVIRDCSVRLERLPSHKAMLTAQETTTHADEESSTEEDVNKKLTCDLCDQSFAVKSDLMEHVMLHIYTPTSVEQGESGDSVMGFELSETGVCKQKPARESSYSRLMGLRDCCVKLERLNSDALAGNHRRPAADTATHANTESDTEEEMYSKACEEPMCALCGEKFVTFANLLKHAMMHIYMPTSNIDQQSATSDEARVNNGLPPYNVNSTKLRDNAEIHGKDNYVCDICGATFRKKYLLIRHIELLPTKI